MVIWTREEQQAITAEGVRLHRTGKVSSVMQAFDLAQAVLPKPRRRKISTISKVPYFSAAIKAAAKAPEAPQSAEQQQVATATAAAPKKPSGGQLGGKRVHWKDEEQKAICKEAARLLLDLQASSPRDAMEKAQLIALPPERRRKVAAMSSLAAWYPDGLQKARLAVLRERERETKAAIDTARKQEQQSPAAAPTPVVEVAPTTALAPVVPASPLALLGDWSRLREHLVQEIANIVAEGIHRGLASVQLAPPQQQASEPAPRHVPFVAAAADAVKERPPSILVVGLRGGQAPQIKAEFGDKLDLRFCTSDQSKDQLRSMTEQADTTIAITDFLSHSHTDIIKARSKRYVESAGGMTHLRQELARLAGRHLNGSGAHAAN